MKNLFTLEGLVLGILACIVLVLLDKLIEKYPRLLIVRTFFSLLGVLLLLAILWELIKRLV